MNVCNERTVSDEKGVGLIKVEVLFPRCQKELGPGGEDIQLKTGNRKGARA
jgi:hypothetical protein